nr:hypothetical protein [Pseudobdellovibrionaceae bacterium]
MYIFLKQNFYYFLIVLFSSTAYSNDYLNQLILSLPHSIDEYCTNYGKTNSSNDLENEDKKRMHCNTISKSCETETAEFINTQKINLLNENIMHSSNGNLDSQELLALKNSSDMVLNQCLNEKAPINQQQSMGPSATPTPEAQQAINLCTNYYNEAYRECGPEKQNSVDTSMGSALDVMANITTSIKGNCDSTVQGLSGAYSLF